MSLYLVSDSMSHLITLALMKCVPTSYTLCFCCVAALPDLPVGAEGAALKDSLRRLGGLHQITRSTMEGVFQALWPKENFWRTSLPSPDASKKLTSEFHCGRSRRAKKVLDRHGPCFKRTSRVWISERLLKLVPMDLTRRKYGRTVNLNELSLWLG